jgi:hypothetical protein
MPLLPAHAQALTIGTFDSHLDPRARACDLTKLRFIDAYGLVGTASALLAGLQEVPDLQVVPPVSPNSRAHLANMGFRAFLAECGISVDLPVRSPVDASGVVVPLRSAQLAGGDQALSHVLWDQLRAHVDAQVLSAVAEGVWEIVGNALEHSGSDAQVMAQVYRRARGGKPPDHDDRVQVVVGDVGRGIYESFRATGVRAPTDELDAIHLALEYLVTSVPDDPGRGQGLFTTMEQVLRLDGRMIVRSGDALVEIDGAGKKNRKVPALPGVIVALSLPLYPGKINDSS